VCDAVVHADPQSTPGDTGYLTTERAGQRPLRGNARHPARPSNHRSADAPPAPGARASAPHPPTPLPNRAGTMRLWVKTALIHREVAKSLEAQRFQSSWRTILAPPQSHCKQNAPTYPYARSHSRRRRTGRFPQCSAPSVDVGQPGRARRHPPRIAACRRGGEGRFSRSKLRSPAELHDPAGEWTGDPGWPKKATAAARAREFPPRRNRREHRSSTVR